MTARGVQSYLAAVHGWMDSVDQKSIYRRAEVWSVRCRSPDVFGSLAISLHFPYATAPSLLSLSTSKMLPLLILLCAYCNLAHAVRDPWVEPTPHLNKDYLFNGWTPKPTPAPYVKRDPYGAIENNQLFARDTVSTCGYASEPIVSETSRRLLILFAFLLCRSRPESASRLSHWVSVRVVL